MDKYLMSSPSHLSQPIDIETYDDDDNGNYNDFTNDFDDSDLSNLMLDSNKSWTENFDQSLIDPNDTIHHKSSNSMISLNNEPPSLLNSQSLESIPQLTSSLSNQSISDSPISFQKQPQAFLPHTTTPRRPNRNKSLSFSSANIYTTPLRSNLPQQSPINSITTTTTKVNKTPHTLKMGHSRSRSRISLDLQPNLHLNPFYTPNNSFISPNKDELYEDELNELNDDDDDDDVVTPLPTPSASQPLRSSSYNHMSGGFISPNISTNSSSSTKNTLFNNSNTTPIPLKRNDTLESIKIEDQDDDAFKQLKKAKSYSSIPSSNSNIATINRSLNKKVSYPALPIDQDENFFNAADLSLRLANHLSNDDPNRPASSHSTPGIYYGNSPQYSNQQIGQQQMLQPNQQQVTQQQLTQQYTQQQFSNFQQQQQLYQQQQQQLQPQQQQFGQPFQLNHTHSAPELQFKSAGIDLLSGQFNSPSSFDGNIDKLSKSLTKKLNQSTITNTFTKSYPASIDLASMTTTPVNSSLSAPPSFKQSNYYQQNSNMVQRAPLSNPNSLLPPMATFSVTSQNQLVQNSQQLQQLQQQQLQQQQMQRSQSQEMLKTAPMAKSIQDALMAPNFNIDIPIVKSNRLDKTDKIDPKKKHKCPICDSRFQRPEHVKRHLKSHSSEKPFQCDEPDCGKRFNRKDNLKAHLKKIHQRKV